MADESTDITSQEELSLSACWAQQNKPAEHFFGIIHAKQTSVQAIAWLSL